MRHSSRLLRYLSLGCICCALLLAACAAPALAAQEVSEAADPVLTREINRLVLQLNDDRGVARDAAEQRLLEMSGSSASEAQRFLRHLPETTEEMPVAIRDRVARIRRQVEDRAAKAATTGTMLTLSAKEMPLAEVYDAIAQQTGNKIRDDRQQPGDGRVTIELEDVPFWPAIDQILDQVGKTVYTYGGDEVLMVIPRDSDDGPRYGRASYVGPFRAEVLEVQGQRHLRKPQRQSLKLQLEVAWEPRLRPIALSQPAADLEAVDESGKPLPVAQPEAVLDVEVPVGSQAAELVLTFALPPRDVTKIALLKGTLRALVPGQTAQFRFDNLAAAAGTTERRGGVQVTVDRVEKNNAIWEIHMRMRLDEDNRALASHRGWVFQNQSYLEGADGEPIDNAGFETTRQTPTEVGIAYLFDLPDGLEGLTWVYETPAAIIEMPIEWELKDIDLP